MNAGAGAGRETGVGGMVEACKSAWFNSSVSPFKIMCHCSKGQGNRGRGLIVNPSFFLCEKTIHGSKTLSLFDYDST